MYSIETRETRRMSTHSVNVLRNSRTNINKKDMKTINIFRKSTRFILFIFAKIKMIMNRLRHDSSILVATISHISNLCILLMTTRLINKFVNRESIEIVRVATNASFV